MKPSWADRIRGWFGARRQISNSFNPVDFEKLCLEDPAAAHVILMEDQKQLAEELEATYAAYDRHVQDVASRLAGLKPDEIRFEARVLRETQDAMRRTLRRIDVSTRTARDLERELQEWEARQEESGPVHADHPLTRAEIIRSELAARGTAALRVIEPERSPFRVIEKSVPPAIQNDAAFVCEDEEAPSIAHQPEQIISLIRMESREAERWHAIPEPDYEAVEQVKHVQSLHALLRQLDRETGIRRDRTELVLRLK